MNGSADHDEQLLADLRDAGSLDAVPADAVAAARAAFLWRTIDAELAELTYDSVLDDQLLAGVRSTATARFLTFESPDLTVEVEASPVGEAHRLMGQLVPPQTGSVELRHPGGSTTVEADELGRFTVDGVPSGPVSLRCRAHSGATVTTDWVLV
jgi:hypothetical protein